MTPTETNNKLFGEDDKSLRGGIGALIRHIRLEAQLTQQQLADKAGCHRTYVVEIEKETRNPSLCLFVHLCEACGVEPQKVLAGILNYARPKVPS